MSRFSYGQLKFLILSARAPVALEWGRQVSAAGHAVYWVDYGAGAVCRHSGLANGFDTVPAPTSEPLAFVRHLNQIIAREGIDYLIPTCEEIFCLAVYRHLLPSDCQVLCADFALLQALHDKFTFSVLARQHGLNPPPTRLLSENDSADLPRDGKRIVKPVYSRFGHQTQIVAAGEAMPTHLPRDGSYLQQAFIDGTEYCSYGVAMAGRLLCHVTYRGKYRYKNGASYYFQATEQGEIERQVSRLVQELNFTGQIAFDWIEESLTGRFYVLECNPRATSGIHVLPQDGGLVRALLGEQIYRPPLRSKMFGAMMLGDALPKAVRSGRLHEWRQDFCRADDVLGSAKLYRGLLQDSRQFYRQARAQGCPIEAVSSQAFEWNGAPFPEYPEDEYKGSDQ